MTTIQIYLLCISSTMLSLILPTFLVNTSGFDRHALNSLRSYLFFNFASFCIFALSRDPIALHVSYWASVIAVSSGIALTYFRRGVFPNLLASLCFILPYGGIYSYLIESQADSLDYLITASVFHLIAIPVFARNLYMRTRFARKSDLYFFIVILIFCFLMVARPLIVAGTDWGEAAGAVGYIFLPALASLAAVIAITSFTEDAQILAEELSLKDALTGLLNRRGFREHILPELARAKRMKQEISVVFVDIDHFKSVNDTHGHHQGDQVIQSLGSLLSKEVRQQDIVARFGGEEFVIFMTGADKAQVFQFAERLRHLVADLTISGGETELFYTVSLGTATALPDMDIERLMQHADKALYTAKNEGRNRVVQWTAVSEAS